MKMTKKAQKWFEEAKKNEYEIKMFFEQYAKQNGCELTYFELVKGDVNDDGLPKARMVFHKCR